MRAGRLRSYLFWGFVISILLHLIFGPLLGHIHYTESEKPEVEKVSVTKRVRISVPTPTPTPRPTPPPTPTPKPTPTPPPTPPPTIPPTLPPVKPTQPPHKNTPPPQPHLKLNVPKAVSTTASKVPSESAYTSAPGSENGVPAGKGTGAGTGTGTSTGTAPGDGTPGTPAPGCAHPHVPASVKNAVQPEFPEIAREQGAQGIAKVKITLNEQGQVSNAVIYQSTGNAALDKEAIKAAEASTYTPEIVDCRPTVGVYVFTADFESQ